MTLYALATAPNFGNDTSTDKIFLDTGVGLDHLADRQPFAE